MVEFVGLPISRSHRDAAIFGVQMPDLGPFVKFSLYTSYFLTGKIAYASLIGVWN